MYKIILISFFSSLLLISCSGSDSLDAETKLLVDALKADKAYNDWSNDDAICFVKDMQKSVPDNMYDTWLLVAKDGEKADVDINVLFQIIAYYKASAAKCGLTLPQ